MFLGVLDSPNNILIRFFDRLKKSWFFMKWEPIFDARSKNSNKISLIKEVPLSLDWYPDHGHFMVSTMTIRIQYQEILYVPIWVQHNKIIIEYRAITVIDHLHSSNGIVQEWECGGAAPITREWQTSTWIWSGKSGIEGWFDTTLSQKSIFVSCIQEIPSLIFVLIT